MQRLLETKGKLLGIDFGDKRTGLAVSDVTRFLASGIGYISVGGMQKTAARVCEIIKEVDVKAIVLGRPARTDGTRSETQDKAEAFGKSLAERCGIEPVFKDERYTTVLASRYLHESNIKAKKQKKVIDQVAAEIILQDYLNTL